MTLAGALMLNGCDGTTEPSQPQAERLAFTVQPSGATAGAVIAPAIQVAIQDGTGNLVATATNTITLTVGTNPGGATLSGTSAVTAVNGVATFDDLSFDRAGSGYTLVAFATGLANAMSDPFDIQFAVFNPTENTEIQDTINYTSVTIPEGVTVTASADLVMNVTGSVEIAGALVGDCVGITLNGGSTITLTGSVSNACSGELGPEPPALVLVGNGDLTVDSATIQSSGGIEIKNDPTLTEADLISLAEASPASESVASTGARGGVQTRGLQQNCRLGGAKVEVLPRKAQSGKAGQIGDPGENGRPVVLLCLGVFNLVGSAIYGQSGGDGGPGIDRDATMAFAEGGPGGKGGDVAIGAGNTIFFRATFVYVGEGGRGGSAEATGLDGPGPKAASAEAVGGAGGVHGGVRLAADIIDFFAPEPWAFSLLVTTPGVQVDAGNGGRARAIAAPGRDATANEPAQHGGDAKATGGAGTPIPLDFFVARARTVTPFESFLIFAGLSAGDGGEADAEGGNGGDGNRSFPTGGDGGLIHAQGGEGGDARANDPFNRFIGSAGFGGRAIFMFGNGGDGFDDCVAGDIRPGGDGGSGGKADGGDGPAGDFGKPPEPSPGGVKLIVVGNSGHGGDGEPPGVAGEPGPDEIVSIGERTEVGSNFELGVDGERCPKIGYSGTTSDGQGFVGNIDPDTDEKEEVIPKSPGERVFGMNRGSFAYVDRPTFGDVTGDIWTAEADGTNPQNITNHPAFYRRGSADPTGILIVFESDRDDPQGQGAASVLNDVFVIFEDGTGLQKIVTDAGFPSVTPDFDLVYSADTDSDRLYEIWIATASGETLLIDDDDANAFSWLEAVVSPDGTKIAVTRVDQTARTIGIAVGDFDGVSVANLQEVASETGSGVGNFNPAWSPGSDRIAFTSDRTGDSEIWVMNADGSSQRNLTQSPSTSDFHPFWAVP